MDIQVSSNFERALYYAYGSDGAAVAKQMDELKQCGAFTVSREAISALRDTFVSGRASEDETAAAVTRYHADHGELLCPHSAVGVHVAEEHLGATPVVTLATAHPAKFPSAVEAASGVFPGLPQRMADLFEREERITRVTGSVSDIKTIIKDRI